METILISYYIGIFIVFASHVSMVASTGQVSTHSAVNLLAVALIAYYFMTKEKFI
jgi:hypothetical protein